MKREKTNILNLVIDFNGLSTCLGLFCALRIGNHVHCTFILIFFVWLFGKRFFLVIYQLFLSNTNNYIIWRNYFYWGGTNYTATCLPSRKLSKLDEPDMQDRAHKWCTPMDPHIWPGKSRTTSTNIHSAAMSGYGMWLWRPTRGDER